MRRLDGRADKVSRYQRAREGRWRVTILVLSEGGRRGPTSVAACSIGSGGYTAVRLCVSQWTRSDTCRSGGGGRRGASLTILENRRYVTQVSRLDVKFSKRGVSRNQRVIR